jgi:hypothetical protein
MKTTRLVTIIGSTLLMLSPTTWAAGHGGGGGGDPVVAAEGSALVAELAAAEVELASACQGPDSVVILTIIAAGCVSLSRGVAKSALRFVHRPPSLDRVAALPTHRRLRDKIAALTTRRQLRERIAVLTIPRCERLDGPSSIDM